MAKKQQGFKHFFIHISIISAMCFCSIYGFFYIYLPSATHHGEAIVVPDIQGIKIADAEITISGAGLRYKVYDSTYTPDMKPLRIINQFPKSGERVKSGRTIYVALSARNPPGIRMPKLIGTSLKAAEMNLKSHGLRLGKVKYIPNANVGAVIEQLFRGKKIDTEKSVKKGAYIDLVVGSGLGEIALLVPELTGLFLDEAKKTLNAQDLGVGSVVYDETSIQPEGTIIRQKPAYAPGDTTNKIKTGEIIDLWVAGKKPDETEKKE